LGDNYEIFNNKLAEIVNLSKENYDNFKQLKNLNNNLEKKENFYKEFKNKNFNISSIIESILELLEDTDKKNFEIKNIKFDLKI
jgi:hypothetical protein